VNFEDIAKEVTRVTPLSVFETLNAINVSDKIEKKENLSYLSWSWAWAELQKRYPDATYTIERFGEDKKPYLYDENTGYMVFTTVTIEGQTREMWLPVMDGANKAMKSKPYQYTVMRWDYTQKKKVPMQKTVEAASMFDINKTLMRCLVKNIGMFGLGLYIYAGEDLPEIDTDTKGPEDGKPQSANYKQEAKAKKTDKEQPIKCEKKEVSGDLLIKFKECQNKLASLGIDIRSEDFMQWMADHTGYGDQMADIQDEIKMNKLIKTYEYLIDKKEQKLKVQSNAGVNQA